MEIVITERDFAVVDIPERKELQPSPLGQPISSGPNVSADIRKVVMDALPKVLMEKVRAIWDVLDGYDLASFEVCVNVAGKPFGVGLEGEMKLTFERNSRATKGNALTDPHASVALDP
jgi:hypothetical protein